MQSSKEEGAWPWGRQICITCTSMCEHQRHLRTWSKVWTAAKITWMVKKRSWALWTKWGVNRLSFSFQIIWIEAFSMPSEQMSWLEPVPPCWLDSAVPLAETAIPPLCFGCAPIPAFPLANFSWTAHSCSLDLQDVFLLTHGSFYFCFPPLRSNYVSRAPLAAEVLKMILAGKSTKSGARRYLASANL